MHAVLMPKQSLNRFILCEHIFFALVSFSIFVLLGAAHAEHPDQSCLVQFSRPSGKRKPLAKAPDSHRDFLTVAIHFAKVPNYSILFIPP